MLATLYLALSVPLLVASLGVVRPHVLGRQLATALALVSMLLSLATPQFVAVGLVITGLLAWHGALFTPQGLVGFGLHALSWALLSLQLWRIHDAVPELDGEPIQDGDHPFAGNLTDEELGRLKPANVTWRPSFTWQVPAMLGVEVVRDVVYREVDGVRLRLDVYRHPHTRAPRPAALYLHGGGWIVGNRRQSQFLLYELAAAGYAVFAISYRRAPRFPLPAAIEDSKYALAWLREHAEEYGANGDDVIVLGGSAGGHLASMVALTGNDPRFQPGFEGADTTVKAAVVFYGVPDFESVFTHHPHPVMAAFLEKLVFRARYRDDPERFRLAQPITHVSPEAPPILLVHGTHDALVPIHQSRRFVQRLREGGATRVHLLEVPLALHGFEVVPSPLHQRAIRVILRFLSTVHPQT